MPAANQLDNVKSKSTETGYTTGCYHCGEEWGDECIRFDAKSFCCEGCKMVYEILNSNDLCRYYKIEDNAGVSLKGKRKVIYAYLDDPELKEKLLDFSNGDQSRITFFIPQIHCASCIWLLENLYKLNGAILTSKVNFLKKEVFITFSEKETTLRKVVELLASIGYEPAINLGDLDEKKDRLVHRSFYYKLGVAGFAFGNIMLLSFPEYLGLDKNQDASFFRLFGYLNILLALPVVFFSGGDYLKSAWLGLRQGNLNIDVPISLGILSLFGRSVIEIVTYSGAGYLDSLAGLVFFLLIGKWFQQRTYHNLSFERDYKSYFPIAATKIEGNEEISLPLDKLEPEDIILIRHKELIPADGILMKGSAKIDYSFVSGESEAVAKTAGDKIFAGGRQISSNIELKLTKKVSQSYLTQLWNDEAFTKNTDSTTGQMANRIGKYFTFAILFIAFGTLFYWLPRNSDIAINAFTAVLIIACPCAVALAIPFIFGNVVRILGRHHLYLKNTSIIEAFRNVQAVVFDKTGTITHRGDSKIVFTGKQLSGLEKKWILATVSHSSHPASQRINRILQQEGLKPPGMDEIEIKNWSEIEGRGIEVVVEGKKMKIGSAAFIGLSNEKTRIRDQGIFVKIDGVIKGYYKMDNQLREGLAEVLAYFRKSSDLFLLSGDNEREKDLLVPVFEDGRHLHFRQKPKDKLNFIKNLQAGGQKVLMLGDGLNDAGALQQSDAGIVIAENTNNFTPACDAILQAGQFGELPKFFEFCRKSIRLVYLAYFFALLYNIVGLSFAVQGALSPIVAAILMPLSSISIVLFGMLSSNWLASRMGL